jgi:hypothetical protein
MARPGGPRRKIGSSVALRLPQRIAERTLSQVSSIHPCCPLFALRIAIAAPDLYFDALNWRSCRGTSVQASRVISSGLAGAICDTPSRDMSSPGFGVPGDSRQ